MQFKSTIIAGIIGFGSMATARIIGITSPKQLGAGQTSTVIIRTQNYIQSIADVSIAFGIAIEEYAHSGTLGTNLLTEKTLGPDLSNTIENITAEITVPSDFQHGEAVLASSLFSLFGSRYSPGITEWNVTVTVADTTDDSETVSSDDATTIF